MAPLDDFHGRDLAWMSDFVREQVGMFLQPLLEHVQESDATVEYMQLAMRRLSNNVSEMESELDHTSQCVAILRQGVGVQSEKRCVMQLEFDKAEEVVKNLEGQVGSLLAAFPSVEKQGQGLCADLEKFIAKQLDSDSILRRLEAGQANNTAHIEDCWRDLRRLQKLQFDAMPQLEDHAAGFLSSSTTRHSTRDTWLQKKSFVASLDDQKYWEKNGSSGNSSAYKQDTPPRGSPTAPLRSNSCVAMPRGAETCGPLAAPLQVAARDKDELDPRRGSRLPPIR